MKLIRYYAFILLLFIVCTGNAAGEQIKTFTTDIAYYFATSHEGKMKASSDFLNNQQILDIPYELGTWEGYELEHNDENLSFFRAYEDARDGVKIYFIAVHALAESKLHTPEVCYLNDNWKISKRGYYKLSLADKQFETRYFIAEKDQWKHYLSYWFMWRDSRRRMNDGCVMFRIAVSMDTVSEETARAKIKDFITHVSGYSAVTRHAQEVKTKQETSLTEPFIHMESEYFDARKETMEWLQKQIVPNEIVQSPANDRRNLILSYELSKDARAYRYIFSKSSLYDNALAVIAFSIEHQFETASKIIDAIMRMGGEDGDLFFTFNTHNSWPNREDRGGALIRSGASAWAGYSIIFYLRAMLLSDPDAIEKNSELKNYLKYAELIADTMLQRSVNDRRDSRYGLITGGNGSYRLRMNEEINAVEEEFVPGEVLWSSMEHNIDMYFFLRDLGNISENEKYSVAAEVMAKSLLEKTWNMGQGQFNRGQRLDGPDEVMALDCASWGTFLLAATGEKEKALRALSSSEKYRSLTDRGVGYKPYIEKPVYENRKVNRFYFPSHPKKNWTDLNMMWTEGALGVSLAHLRFQNIDKARDIINEVLKYRTESGGIAYSSLHIAHEFSMAPGVAPAAWLIINLGELEQNEIAQLFWDQ
jgi:hypothetical protein